MVESEIFMLGLELILIRYQDSVEGRGFSRCPRVCTPVSMNSEGIRFLVPTKAGPRDDGGTRRLERLSAVL